MLSHRRKSKRRGTSTVEFALTAPILFAIVMGAFEFSRANMFRHTAAVAATEAARKSVVAGATAADCIDCANEELANVGIQASSVQISPSTITKDTTEVTVDIQVPMDSSNGFILADFVTGKSIRRTVTMQREAKVVDHSNENNGNAYGIGNGNGYGNGNGVGGGNGTGS